MAATTEAPQKLSDALVAFSLEGRFPEDISVLPPVSETDLQPAIQALAEAKKGLEAELHTINQETKQDVDSWVRNSKALQEDIFRSKAMANEIERQSEAPDVSGEAVQDAEEKAEFLNREVQYSQQLHDVLQKIKFAVQSLDEAEEAYHRPSVHDSLLHLKLFEKALNDISVSKSCRVMKLLKLRSFKLHSSVREMFDHHWKTLINADIETRQFTIRNMIADEHGEVQMELLDVACGLDIYKEIDEHMEQLWRNLDATIISPRMDIRNATFPSIQEDQDILKLSGEASRSVDALLTDLETAFAWVSRKIPKMVFPPLANFMVADVIPRLIGEWLAPAVPSSLKDMDSFQAMIQRTQKFCQNLTEYKYTGLEDLQNWVDNAPSIWLGKCRETTLDSVRSKLLGGIGESKQVEKVEKQMVSIAEGKEITKTPGGAGATAETADWGADWGDAWEEDNQQPKETKPTKGPGSTKADEDDGADAWGWDEEDTTAEPKDTKEASEKDDEDDAAAAWGWGDEDTVQEPEPAAKKIKSQAQQETRELVLKETYSVSSMPEPVLELIQAILEDGAALTRDDVEYAPVAATAPGLFGLPTFALALFRAISPYYYSLSEGGNMFLYNDAMYLAERLSEFADAWKKREDLTPRARNMLRLDNDVKSLQSFANRSYANEMNIQKTILRDFLGGAQSLMQQDEMESCVELATGRIRAMASVWKSILARSVWTQALGSLVEAVATKLITDVLEMSSIGQDEAYNIAKVIATATELDDLFLPSVLAGTPSTEDEVPQTAQYAPSWLRLKYLSEVLQSNLNEVRYLWFESELSLYFSASEVVDLIEASFESNPRTRETIREIQSKPAPSAQR
ncbi:uncharacterized protein B0J16DRAFT_51459 [Fusarium flagelliforme]|uniref:Centromere/kinetochore protein zw10 like protein n=1 Tax=Fusarium flagelliforme TaxID=2675880 RepID=A0A395N4M8_9HYPO|nr:uncharacterized protein B0J16DRAFT_51459 [Fusarium flagelliforme]KAH7191932.1 hypothetical protein B0J16DRAFT_51459 [Fusarium flagelliforme]RFN55088.1 centromere/kinetochore protein zw10 like protein [Fusarium flagelliforme]